MIDRVTLGALRSLLIVTCVILLAACGGAERSTSGAPSQPDEAGADLQVGAQAFASNGCGGCHTLAAAGATGAVGPDLDEVLPGKSARSIRRSILDPEAEIPPGYYGGIMPDNFGSSLSSEELEDLVAYLMHEAGHSTRHD